MDWLFCTANPWLILASLYLFSWSAYWNGILEFACSIFCEAPISGRLSRYLMSSVGVSFCSRNDSHGFFLHPVKLQLFRLWQGCETQTIVSDAKYHALVQQNIRHCSMPFEPCFQCLKSFPTPKFCQNGTKGMWGCLCVLWLLHWRRLLASPVPLLC